MIKDFLYDALQNSFFEYLILYFVIFGPYIIILLLSLFKDENGILNMIKNIASYFVLAIFLYFCFKFVSFTPDSTFGNLANVGNLYFCIITFIDFVLLRTLIHFSKLLIKSRKRNIIVIATIIVLGIIFIIPVIDFQTQNKIENNYMLDFTKKIVKNDTIYRISYKYEESKLIISKSDGKGEEIILEKDVDSVSEITDDYIYFKSKDINFKYDIINNQIIQLK